MDKRAKELARRRKLVERGKRQAEYRERTAYPEFVFVENDAPPEFVAAVREAVTHIDFTNRTQFKDWEAEVYKEVRAGRPVPKFSERLPSGAVRERVDIATYVITNVGEQVFRHIPPGVLARFIPHNDVMFLPTGGAIFVHFRSLRRAKGSGGTVYYSRHKPTVVVDGRELVVGFSTHAIERTCERVLTGPLSYTNLGDVFALFEQCLEFEVAPLPRGQLGFTFWGPCERGFWTGHAARHVLGNSYDDNARYSYRVGYCPAVIEGDFLKAKTLLYPGWDGTNEYDLLRSASLPHEQKRAWLDLLGKMDGMRFRVQALPLLRFFHDQGLHQIRLGEPKYAEVATREELASAKHRTSARSSGSS